MKEIIENIISKLWEDILEYCVCWSWKKYKDCCWKNINIFWNLEYKNFDIKKSKQKNFNEILTNELSGFFWKDIVWNIWDKPKCIIDNCNNHSIESHLFSDSYLKNNKQNNKFKILKPLSLKEEQELQWSKSLKTHLFCLEHDKEFNITDEINNFWDILNDNEKLKNFITKTIYFRYKNLAIAIRHFISSLYEENNEHLIQKYFVIYKNTYEFYNYICIQKNNIENSKKFQPIIHCKIQLNRDNKTENVFYSNIVLKDKIPFYISCVQDNYWMYIIIWSFEGDNNVLDKENILLEIKDNLKILSKKWWKDICKFIEKYFKLTAWENRLWFIYWDELVDIWLKTTN